MALRGQEGEGGMGARGRNVVLAFACQANNYKLYVVLILPSCIAVRRGTKKEQVNILQWRSIFLLKSLFLYMRSK